MVTFWRANQKLETLRRCNLLQVNSVTSCQLQPYLCNVHYTGFCADIEPGSATHFSQKTAKRLAFFCFAELAHGVPRGGHKRKGPGNRHYRGPKKLILPEVKGNPLKAGAI